MKKVFKQASLLALFSLTAGAAFAQYVPSHGKYVTYITDSKSFYDYFPTWEPGQQLSEDENFFISRVKIKDRFINRETQVLNNEKNNQRKFSLCTPMGISDTYWQTLPRYVMDADNFSMWSYLDSQGGWSQSWIRTVGAYSDVCHKNGVANSGGVIFFDSWGGDNTSPQKIVNMLVQKNSDGTFKYLDKFIKFLRYYGVDGVTFNPEGTIQNASLFQDFLAAVHEKVAEYGWQFHVTWYGANNNNGNLDLGSQLTASKANWFIKNGKTVSDIYFLNYDWSSSITSSQNYAEGLRAGSSSDVYAGYDIQGNWLARGNWNRLKGTTCSVIFWGNHTTDMIYQNSTENGSSDEAVQKCYLQKQEEVFSGGNRNPAKTPTVTSTTGVSQSSSAAMKKFHGVCALVPARSSLQELPFITRFSLGNGKAFRNEGQETFHGKWYSLSSQDYLPTWRWWITNAEGNVPTDGINCGFTFDDSWYAGSCMKMNGATACSNVRLFKTNFNVSGDDAVNLVYKLNNTTESHAKLFWSFVGSEKELHYAAIPDAEEGVWTEFKSTAGKLDMTGNVALLGVQFENTASDYEMLFGEFGIVPVVSYTPVKPTITKSQFLERTYNSVSYKLIWDCGKSAAAQADPSMPTYNADIDTWYFEVYSQAEGKEPVLDGVTTSWAHYIVGAFSDPTIEKYRFGVRAVAPDGKTASEIAWSDYTTIEATTVDGISLDKSIIKSGEEFTVSYTDPLHAEAIKWQVVDPATGKDMAAQTGGTGLKAAINEIGTYDVVLTDGANETTYYRGFVQVSPAETGALPIANDFVADKTDLTFADNTASVTYNIERLGEGKVSRGLELEDAYQFRIPQEALPKTQKQYTVGCWIKPYGFAHSKYGTNLFNKRNIQRSWPHNNWGAFWTIIWPEWYNSDGSLACDANVISYTMYESSNKSFAGNSNKHETAFVDCTTDRHLASDQTYALNANTWTHVMICYDGSKQKIFFNGKKVCECTTNFVEYDESPIYIGGSNVYHAGINGVIDDVQVWHKALTEAEVKEAMQGYEGKTVPAELKAYYTFESHDAANHFPNLGSGTSTWYGDYIQLVGAAGEATVGATEVILDPNNNIMGNPALPGSLEIKTTATLSDGIEGPGSLVFSGNGVTGGNLVVDAATANGPHDITFTLSNMWGKSEITKPAYITVSGQDGIETISVGNASNAIFNLAGQRVKNASNGVYIINGKKVIR